MAKKQLANTETDKDVNAFIEAIPNGKRRADSLQLLSLLGGMRKEEPKIWGVSIIAFGKYTYQRKNKEEYEWFNVGFSPGKSHLSVYLMYDVNQEQALLQKLGPHKTGKGCLYIKSLKDIDINILKKLLKKSDKWDR